jgi:hypothetical protein
MILCRNGIEHCCPTHPKEIPMASESEGKPEFTPEITLTKGAPAGIGSGMTITVFTERGIKAEVGGLLQMLRGAGRCLTTEEYELAMACETFQRAALQKAGTGK